MLKKEKSDGKSHFYCFFLNFGSKFMSFSVNNSMGRLLSEVPGLDVVVETDAIGAAILGDDLHDFLLLLWREQVLAMMVTVVRAIATTEERANTMTSLSLVSLWDIVIEMC